MAACTTTYFEAGRGLSARVAERNAELLAQQPMRRRGVRTPEVPFTKHFDNSRLVKAPDPVRVRQMRIFSAAVTVLFSLIMVYGLQHFSAIESGYRIESEKQVLRPVARGESPVASVRGAADRAGPHRQNGPRDGSCRAAAGSDGSSQCQLRRLCSGTCAGRLLLRPPYNKQEEPLPAFSHSP